MSLREDHRRLTEVGVPGRGRLLVSAGVRGAPGLAPGLPELLSSVPPLEGRVLDLTASAGAGVYAASAETDVVVLEPSAAGARAALATFSDDDHVRIVVGLPWNAPDASFEAVLLAPPADRGSERVRAEIAAAAAAVTPTGAAYMVGHKDLGAKRYEREAGAHFGRLEMLSKQRGWRVVRLSEARSTGQVAPWTRFHSLGRDWWALPGVFAAGRLDQGSAALLRTLLGLPPDAGEEVVAAAIGTRPAAGCVASGMLGAAVLDVGCGVGPLSWTALRSGAREVVALDDDVGAVRCTERNLTDMDAAEAGGGDARAVGDRGVEAGAGEAGKAGAGAAGAGAPGAGAPGAGATGGGGPGAGREWTGGAGAGREWTGGAGAGAAGAPTASVRVVHSDLDEGLEPGARFDVVLMNPPFHLGKQVRVTLGRAFLEVAQRRLRPGGWMALVANRALPYEPELERWGRWETLGQDASFKVLRAWR